MQLQVYATKIAQGFKKSSSNGSLLDDIAKGTRLKPVPKIEKPKEKGGLQETLGESDLLKKARQIYGEQTREIDNGASDQEWEESEKVQPTAPKKTPEKPIIPSKPETPKQPAQNPSTAQPAAPKPTIPGGSETTKPPFVLKPAPAKPFSPTDVVGGALGLKKTKPLKSEIAAIDFSKMDEDDIEKTVSRYKNDIVQFSLTQLLDIAKERDQLDRLDPDIVDDLKAAARAKKDQADPGQLAALKFRYGIA